MDQGCHSNYVIHGYSDKGVGSMCMAIRGWTILLFACNYNLELHTFQRHANAANYSLSRLPVCTYTRKVRDSSAWVVAKLLLNDSYEA